MTSDGARARYEGPSRLTRRPMPRRTAPLREVRDALAAKSLKPRTQRGPS
jgi:hypothetical protein